MSEQINSELKKLMAIAHDLELAVDLRGKAIEQIGKIGTHDALLALLDIAADEHATIDERDMALKYAREIIKSSR
jgi:hypothetical protein